MSEAESRNAAKERIRHRRSHGRSVDALFAALRSGDRQALSEAITLVERKLPAAREEASALLSLCLQANATSRRIGITGVPGVGKSTFIERFGLSLIAQGHRVAVLAIDPSSSRSGGSILGDKTRMNELSQHPNAFIRPSAAADTLGGVARATRESILLCEAAGFDTIIVETVGVGQSETTVHGMVDFFLLLMLSGAGDELQGIKRGIMEMADALYITKADGENTTPAERAARQYASALHLFPANANGWTAEVGTCSALEGSGIDELNAVIDRFFNSVSASGWMVENRKRQDLLWLEEALKNEVMDVLRQHPEWDALFNAVRDDVAAKRVSPFSGAHRLVQRMLGRSV